MKDKYFLYVGNAYPHKNLEVLLQAFKDIHTTKLVLVGKDDYFYKRLKQTELVRSLKGRVIFKTSVSDEVASFCQSMLDSFFEGSSWPVMTAKEEASPRCVTGILA